MFSHCITYDDLPEIIPIFPLERVMLLPGGLLPLNIFEERYLRMVDDALRSHRMIGMIQPDPEARANGQADAIYLTGCAGRVVQWTETDDNRYLITLKGLIRFEVKSEISSALPYRQAKADWSDYEDDLVEDCDPIEMDRSEFLPMLECYFKANHMECDFKIVQQSPCRTLLTLLPMICPFDAQEKQALLEAKTMEDRYRTLRTLLKFALNHDFNCTTIKH